MKTITTMVLLFLCSLRICAQQAPTAVDTPQLEFALQLRVTIDGTYTVGNLPYGKRVVVPITGGTFEGPLLKGTIVPGGADYQIVSNDGKRMDLEAIYSIRTDDGVYIHVRNKGMVSNDPAKPYFKTVPQFEAPADSRYAWLNDAIFVCQPDFSEHFQGIVLNVWKVK